MNLSLKLLKEDLFTLRSLISKELQVIYSKAGSHGMHIGGIRLDDVLITFDKGYSGIYIYYQYIKLTGNFGKGNIGDMQAIIRGYSNIENMPTKRVNYSMWLDNGFIVKRISIYGKHLYWNFSDTIKKEFDIESEEKIITLIETENIFLLEFTSGKRMLIAPDEEHGDTRILFKDEFIDDYLNRIAPYEYDNDLSMEDIIENEEKWNNGAGEKLYKIKHIIE